MRINFKDGRVFDIPIELVDSITFMENASDESREVTLTGEWLWGSKEKGYYEVLTFNEDRTYTGYDYYLDYGFDTMTYGSYMNNGVMLNLWSNGYGYRRTYRWFVTALTENALEVMTQMGNFIYYRIQPAPLYLKSQGEPIACEDGSRFVFADDIKVTIKENKLYGVASGMTYIQVSNLETGNIKAYKVIVE